MHLTSCITNRAAAFYSIVAPYLNGTKVLVEFCAGDGKGGAEFDNSSLENIIFVDKRKPNKFQHTAEQLKTPFEYKILDINNTIIPQGSIVIAIHACGILTDIALEKAIKASLGFAIMPCCYNQNMKKYSLRNPPDNRKLCYPAEKDYYDAFRLQYIQEQGYNAILSQIDERITPMNNILIGIPEFSYKDGDNK